MNFDVAVVTSSSGDVRRMTPPEFFAIPLGERIQLILSKCIRFEKDKQVISPMDALKSR